MIFTQKWKRNKEDMGNWKWVGLHCDGVDNSTMSKIYPKYSPVYTGTSAAPVTGGIAIEKGNQCRSEWRILDNEIQ